MLAATTALALVGGLFTLDVSGAAAHDGAQGVVKERQDAMEALKTALKVAGPLVSGVMDYDAAKVRESAGIIASHGGEAMTKLFPEGSIEKPSEALPDIWEKWDRFSALAADMKTKAEVVAAFADDQGKAASAFGALSDTCKACHRSFKD
jgi:cytochrome c556